jgi:hypothetical protein
MTKSRLLTLLIATASALSTSAFASGYGPAPFYRPVEGAPASERGVSAQTIAAEQASRVEASSAKTTENLQSKVAQSTANSQAQQ